jgi:hypothetical protein
MTTQDVLIAMKSNAQPGSALYQQIDRLRSFVERAVVRWLKWGLTANEGFGQGNFFEYYDGKNYGDIVLRKNWITNVINVWWDPLAAYGQNNSNYTPFGPQTLLTNGVDYSMVWEQTGLCKSAILRRMRDNLFLWPSQWMSPSSNQGLSYSKGPVWPAGAGNVKVQYDYGFQPPTLYSSITWANGVATMTFPGTVVVFPAEPFAITNDAVGWNGDWAVVSVGSNNQSITFNSATNYGPSTGGTFDCIPYDVKLAIAEACGMMRTMVPYGGQVGNENLGDYGYGLNFRERQWGGIRELLAGYRDLAVGIAL